MLSYMARLEYLGGFCEDFAEKSNWWRDFQVPENTTLEQLNIVIQSILEWDDVHACIFEINGANRVFLGYSYFLLQEYFTADEEYLSCDIALNELDLAINDAFVYRYDLADKHAFLLTIRDIMDSPSTCSHPILHAVKGPDLCQYPDPELDHSIQFASTTPSYLLPRSIVYKDYTREVKNHVRFITARDYRILLTWRRSKDKKNWERAVVLLENRSMTLKDISAKIEVPLRKIRKWIRRFNQNGLAGLNEVRKKPDRRDLEEKTELKRKRVLEILHERPHSHGINRSNWSQPALSEAYEKRYGEPISTTTVGELIRKTKYTWRKARRVLTSPDPLYREKVELLLKTLRSLKEGEMLFFVDEIGPIRVKKHGGRCYVKKGEAVKIPKKSKDKGSVTLFGALNGTTNQVTWCYGTSKDTSSMIDIAEMLFNQYHDCSKLYITWDAASWHRSNELTEWLDEFNSGTRALGTGPLIEFIPLPTSSQFLNVIEAVFSGMTRAVIHHSDYQSSEEMKSAISLHFIQRNEYFEANPRRVGKKIWEVNFFENNDNIKSGDYREW